MRSVRMRWLSALALAAGGLGSGALGACVVPQAFVCSADGDCGETGVCQESGYCAFPDDECRSGYRYGNFAIPQYANECTEPEYGEGESGETTAGDGDGDGGETVGDSFTGDGDGDDTLTGDGDGDDTDTFTGDGDGDTTGDGDGDTSGDGDGDEELGPYLYTLHVNNGTWTRAPLALVLNDPNAPNEVEIIAATRLETSERLVFVGADQRVYLRDGGSFEAPVDLDDWTNGDLPSGTVTAMSHDPDPDQFCEEIIFYLRDVGTARLSMFLACEGVPLIHVGNQQLNSFFNYQQETETSRFAFMAPDLLQLDDPDGRVTYRALDSVLGVFTTKLDDPDDVIPLANNEFWVPDEVPNQPDPTTVQAAYFDAAGGGNNYLFVVAP